MAPTSHTALFEASDAELVGRELHELTGPLLDAMGADLSEALHGSEEATRRYVQRYRLLTRRLLAAAQPGRPAWYVIGALESTAADAPFTPWITRFDVGDAVALHLTNRVRAMFGAAPLAAPEEPLLLNVEDLDAERFLRRVRAQLNHPDDEPPLQRLMDLFALSKTELGRLFGVSRQAIDGWLDQDVPADRQEKLSALLALADLLERKLKAGRAPGVARRAAEAYGGLSMLEMIAADRHGELLDSVRASFAWSEAA